MWPGRGTDGTTPASGTNVGEVTPDKVKMGEAKRSFPGLMPSYYLYRPNHVKIGRDEHDHDVYQMGCTLFG